MQFFRYVVHKIFPTQNACVSKREITQLKIDEMIQKLISSSTPWSIAACQIPASLLMRFFRYVVHKLVPIQNACV